MARTHRVSWAYSASHTVAPRQWACARPGLRIEKLDNISTYGAGTTNQRRYRQNATGLLHLLSYSVMGARYYTHHTIALTPPCAGDTEHSMIGRVSRDITSRTAGSSNRHSWDHQVPILQRTLHGSARKNTLPRAKTPQSRAVFPRPPLSQGGRERRTR